MSGRTLGYIGAAAGAIVLLTGLGVGGYFLVRNMGSGGKYVFDTFVGAKIDPAAGYPPTVGTTSSCAQACLQDAACTAYSNAVDGTSCTLFSLPKTDLPALSSNDPAYTSSIKRLTSESPNGWSDWTPKCPLCDPGGPKATQTRVCRGGGVCLGDKTRECTGLPACAPFDIGQAAMPVFAAGGSLTPIQPSQVKDMAGTSFYAAGSQSDCFAKCSGIDACKSAWYMGGNPGGFLPTQRDKNCAMFQAVPTAYSQAVSTDGDRGIRTAADIAQSAVGVKNPGTLTPWSAAPICNRGVTVVGGDPTVPATRECSSGTCAAPLRFGYNPLVHVEFDTIAQTVPTNPNTPILTGIMQTYLPDLYNQANTSEQACKDTAARWFTGSLQIPGSAQPVPAGTNGVGYVWNPAGDPTCKIYTLDEVKGQTTSSKYNPASSGTPDIVASRCTSEPVNAWNDWPPACSGTPAVQMRTWRSGPLNLGVTNANTRPCPP